MSGNLISDLYRVKEAMFHKKSMLEELNEIRTQVKNDIDRKAIPYTPHFLFLKLTDRCNSDCAYCAHAISFSNENNFHDLPHDLVLKTISESALLGVSAIILSGGEPLVRSDIYEIIESIVDHGIVPVLLTNGLLLSETWDKLGAAGLKYVIISFDSLRKEVYEKQRGCNFEKALEGIESAIKMREKYKDVEIHVSAVLDTENQEDMIELVKYFSEKGIRLHVSPFHDYLSKAKTESRVDPVKTEIFVKTLLQMKSDGYLIASSKGFIEHLADYFCHNSTIPDDFVCKIGYTNLFVDAQKNVRPCWSNVIGTVGILGEESLKDFWYGDKMHECRGKMIKCQCEGCWYMCTAEVTMLLDNRLD